MKIKMIKIRRHWWSPLVCKDVILEITNNQGRKYKQTICNGWTLNIKKGIVTKVDVNYVSKCKPLI